MNRPDWFDRLVENSAGRNLNDYRLIDSLYQEVQAVEHDTFDARKYAEMYEQSDLSDLSRSRKLDHPTWPPVIQDAYLGLWKARPNIREKQEMRKSHLLNQATMEKVISTQEYEELRTWTKLDDWAAAMGTTSLADKLAKYFDEQEDLTDKQDKLQQQEEDMLEAMNAMQQSLEEDLTDDQVEDFLDAMESMLEEYEETAEEFENTIQGQQYGLREAVQDGLEAAQEAAEETIELVQGFGTDPGQWTRLDARMRMQLAKRVHGNKTLHEIAKMVGRMKRMAVGQWQRRVIHGVDEIYDVEIGNDLEHVLPSELIYLADEETEDIFFAKFLDRSLMQYALRGVEKSAQGPIVVCLDNSGSMGGEREVWGKAVALSLLEIAKRERRDFYGIHFGAARDWHGKPEMAEWHFPKGDVNLPDVLDYAEFFFNGGTDFETPLSRAVEVMETHFMDAGAAKGDIVFITDGECSVHPEWLTRYLNAKKEMGFRVYGILIGHQPHVLRALSDEVFSIKDLVTGGEVKGMFTLL